MFTDRQINVFRAIMSAGSVTAAARRLNLSQPSVSRLLAELEAQFSCPLFVRGSRGVIPTPEAHLFFDEVERTYGVLSSLEEAAHEIAAHQRGALNFGAIAAFSFEIIPRALEHLGVRNHEVSVTWRIRNSEQLINWALNGNLALGLAYVEGDLLGLNVIHQCELPHMCLFPLSHRLNSSRRPLRLAELSRERVVGMIGSTAEIIHRQRIGHPRNGPLIVETSYAAAALAETIDAVAIVDPFSAQWFARTREMACRPLADFPTYKAALFEPINAKASLLALDFQQHIIDEIKAATFQLR